ncbi:MAG TPA: nuclear transport factor 2 family protein, partial [Solirubrobacteraceae bacterium]|nr:nuclear transport factor 2 family protein [Solirubrobacteraceae bacterium]
MYFHPEVEFMPLRSQTEGSYRGRAGVRAYTADTYETFERFEISDGEFRDLGDRVLWSGIVRLRARGSGIETTIPLAIVVEFSDGKI